MMTVADITSFLFSWAPGPLAWEKDNVGLIVGDPHQHARSILVSLDVTESVLQEAIASGANVIVAHHPPIFQPIRNIRFDTQQGDLLRTAIHENIAIIAMHTNADSVRNGINTSLAKSLGLLNIQPLEGRHDTRCRLLLHLAYRGNAQHLLVARLRELSLSHSMPRDVGEQRFAIEIDVDAWSVPRMLSDIASIPGLALIDHGKLPVSSAEAEHGLGAVGPLPDPMPVDAFLEKVKATLQCSHLRVSMYDQRKPISVVAVCGGSGSSLIGKAVAARADIMITADLKYHDFLDFQNEIILVDAGHFETERQFIPLCASILSGMHFPDSEKISIFTSSINTSPIRFV